MALGWIDWAIVATVITGILIVAVRSRVYMCSVADFLAAGRTARRYMLTVTSGSSGHGAVRILALFELGYQSGFVTGWWQMLISPVTWIIALSGFVIYRFRQTRALTLAQFLEMRYSRSFRIFVGTIIFISGILNLGIFPQVAARFFIYYCGLPASVSILGIEVSTLAIVMFLLLFVSVYLTFGGQITIILTDFCEGMFTNVAFLVILLFIFLTFDWSKIQSALLSVPPAHSMVNPFDAGEVKDFNVWYILIASFWQIYCTMAWQGGQGFNTAPASPHEARMGKIIGSWREISFTLMVALLPVVAFAVMHHPDFAGDANVVNSLLSKVDNQQLVKQITVPAILSQILPIGIKGLFAAVMFCGFVSNMDTYLHSWGSILIQDVIMPFSKKPMSPREHIKILRWSIVGVAIFIFIFSLLYKPTEYIFMFFFATGAIYMTGAGSIIIGGLYWKRGTTKAAWATMIGSGAAMAAAFIARQILPEEIVEKMPNSQILTVIGMVIAISTYVIVSLLSKDEHFNLNKMLHKDETVQPFRKKTLFGRVSSMFKLDKEFSRSDKGIYICSIIWMILWGIIAFGGSIMAIFGNVQNETWFEFWKLNAWIGFILGVGLTLWISIGGLYDLRYMLNVLRTALRDQTDDGTVYEDFHDDKVSEVPHNVSEHKKNDKVADETQNYSRGFLNPELDLDIE